MSALRHHHLNVISSSTDSPSQTLRIGIRPSMVDRFSQVLHEIEAFLLACTHEEMCRFWNAIADLRQYLEKNSQKTANSSEVPQFLNSRRKQRDFCRILEVLADLPYPKLHRSHHLPKRSGDRRNYHASAHPHLATQR